jgi:hypothetical protein
MAMPEGWVFPKIPTNRPGLERIGYRIGSYADFRLELMRLLNDDPMLAKWTHRDPDDPGIALLESAAILGDILAFYQDFYANEAYLRTAQQPFSITELVRLLGYRPSPGLGGQTTFAFQVEDGNPVVIPKGFPVSAQLEGENQPADFETCEEIDSYSELNSFQLFPPLGQGLVRGSTMEFYCTDQTLDLKPGDRLILGRVAAAIPSAGENNQEVIREVLWQHETPEGQKKQEWVERHEKKYGCYLKNAETAIIDSIRVLHGVQVFKIKGALQHDFKSLTVDAYPIGRTFNHFGHNAPQQTVVPDANKQPVLETTTFDRILDDAVDNPPVPGLTSMMWPLDVDIHDLAAGRPLLCALPIWNNLSAEDVASLGGNLPGGIPEQVTWVRTIQAAEKTSLTWGPLTGSSTRVTLDRDLAPPKAGINKLHAYTDIRQVQLHEAVGPCLTLRAVPASMTTGSGLEVYFFGSDFAAQTMTNRPVLMQAADGALNPRLVIRAEKGANQLSDFCRLASGWKLTLNQPVDYRDWPKSGSQPVFYGNLASANQGKTEQEVPLGNGDPRQGFQTFKLPKAPLTYYNELGRIPPEKPEAQIYVNERLWNCVPSFFGRGPEEEIYIIREDENQDSWVQFGDGKTGCRLPAGVKNVTAVYRTGIGSQGQLQDGSKPQAGQNLNGLDKVVMPGPVLFGSRPEDKEKARLAGPGKVQSLDRMVSLQDYETEALTIGGVVKARADWALLKDSAGKETIPGIQLTVMLSSGQAAGVADLQAQMDDKNRRVGASRFLVNVVLGELVNVALQANVQYDPTYREPDVEAAIGAALGVSGLKTESPLGLFSVPQRDFGQPEYASRVAGTIQNVPGVLSVTGIVLNSNPADDAVIACDPDRILALPEDRCTLNLTSGRRP